MLRTRLGRRRRGRHHRPLLLERGAHVDSRDKDDWTPLLYAAEHGKTAVVQVLLENSADINGRGYQDITPLSMAVKHARKPVVQLLLEKGA